MLKKSWKFEYTRHEIEFIMVFNFYMNAFGFWVVLEKKIIIKI